MQCPIYWVTRTKPADFHKTGRKSCFLAYRKGTWCFPSFGFPHSNCCNWWQAHRIIKWPEEIVEKRKKEKRDGGVTPQLKEVAGERKLKGMSWQQYGIWLQYKESPFLGSQSFLPSRSQKNPHSRGSISLLTSQHLENTDMLEVQVVYPCFSHLRTQTIFSEKWKGVVYKWKGIITWALLSNCFHEASHNLLHSHKTLRLIPVPNHSK